MSLVKNINFKLGSFELLIPELPIADLGVTALLGESGSGKTTLLNVLIGVHQPNNWEWSFKGTDLAKLEVSERRLGVVFQGYDLFPHLTARQNVEIVLKSRYLQKENQQMQLSKLAEATEQLKLQKCWNTKAENLSGGEKQRVALLRAVFSDPRMLILDEPFSALDAELKTESREILKNFIAKLDLPVLLVTHDSEDVKLLAQHTFRMKNGKIIA